MNKRIGAITIGQSPRPDLLAPLQELMKDYEILEFGALDNLTAKDLPDPTLARYPLTTLMRDGTTVIVDEDFVTPLLQEAITRFENYGVVATILLCAGEFDRLQSKTLLFNPFDFACTIIRAMGLREIGVVCPSSNQKEAIQKKWSAAGFSPRIWVPPRSHKTVGLKEWLPIIASNENKIDCIVLDYVGYPTEQIVSLQAALNLPVIDLGHLIMTAMTTILKNS